MRKLFFVFALAAIVFGCSNDESEPSCRLISVSTLPLWFEDYLTGVPSSDPTFDGKLHFSYVNGKIAKVKGGMMRRSDPHTFFMTGSVEDSLVYNGDSVRVYVAHNIDPFLQRVHTYRITNNQLTYWKKAEVSVSGLVYFPNLTYEYNGDTILEKRNGNLWRVFEMQNGNLTKVTQNFYDAQGQYAGKREWLFTDYDTSPNLLKGKFYIEGAFFAAFSNNNYRRWEERSSYVLDGQEIFGGPSYVEYGLTYDADGSATLFEQSCN
ncbi:MULTISPECIES: hypothetical protein [unclassified Flavobacterium]|uniref:hypothetical protein n=1 Tax=unclassified Flavobacterium TaxID=196869 RepID=UPI001F13B7BC|nr:MULTISPECIES: hypothetical protein [unclassified Flavobacterium]UMY67002.1 hypothetical protein MKO97_06370 [Flavobacterium sp. HJ-32-4]